MIEEEALLNRLIQNEDEAIREQFIIGLSTIICGVLLYLILPVMIPEKDFKEKWIPFGSIALSVFGATKPTDEVLKRKERIRNYKTLEVVFTMQESESKRKEMFLKFFEKLSEKTIEK